MILCPEMIWWQGISSEPESMGCLDTMTSEVFVVCPSAAIGIPHLRELQQRNGVSSRCYMIILGILTSLLVRELWFLFLFSCPSKFNTHFFSGGVAEKPASGAVVGPTFQCLIAEQFRRAKFGDRFFFTHRDSATVKTAGFNNRQLRNLKGRRLGDILCDNTEFVLSKANVFLQGKLDLACCSINKLDLSLFL